MLYDITCYSIVIVKGDAMKGAILEKGEDYYTYLQGIFASINDVQKKYNWLITDCECYPQNMEFEERIFQFEKYGWLSGEELTDIIRTEDFQWIWGVLSGFNKDITLGEILKYDLPYADGYSGFWKNPVSIQHPLAQIEIVPWDSSCTIIISKDDSTVEAFIKGYPLSIDLAMYNEFDDAEELENWLKKNKT